MTWIEAGTRELSAPSVKQKLAALRHLFDWLVNSQLMPVNPGTRNELAEKCRAGHSYFPAQKAVFGRPCNESGRADPPAGRRRQVVK
jgi:hypothetical protein